MEDKKENCTIYLVRHGETEWNSKDLIQGHSDSPLNPNGEAQARELKETLKNIKFDAIFSSDSPRCVKTAQIIAEGSGLPVQTSELLRECNYGAFEGQPASELKKAAKEKLKEINQLPDAEQWSFVVDPEAETHESIINRFTKKLEEIGHNCAGKNILVVSHGGPIRLFLIKNGYASFKELPRGSFKNGAYMKAVFDGERFKIKEVMGVNRNHIINASE